MAQPSKGGITVNNDVKHELIKKYDELKHEAFARLPAAQQGSFSIFYIDRNEVRKQLREFCVAQGHEVTMLDDHFRDEDLSLSNFTGS